jgi:hypothetical protein
MVFLTGYLWQARHLAVCPKWGSTHHLLSGIAKSHAWAMAADSVTPLRLVVKKPINDS